MSAGFGEEPIYSRAASLQRLLGLSDNAPDRGRLRGISIMSAGFGEGSICSWAASFQRIPGLSRLAETGKRVRGVSIMSARRMPQLSRIAPDRGESEACGCSMLCLLDLAKRPSGRFWASSLQRIAELGRIVLTQH